MSVALTTYEPVVRRIGGNDVAKMSVWKNGDYVKFDEAINSIQQLQAKIRAIVSEFCDFYDGDLSNDDVSLLLTKLRELSAVQ
jgi:hypothetical protein